MRIAVVGTGIAGNAAALACASAGHDVVVYERASRPGGHACTVDIDYDGAAVSVDIGFIVYNEMNYPGLSALFRHLGVATKSSEMSFSVSADNGRFEWCGRDGRGAFDGLFAQRRNLASPSYLRMLRDVLRFQAQAKIDAAAQTIGTGTLGEYLARHRFSARLRDDYLVPMGAAIWSMSAARMLDFPASRFIAFFDNHHLLQWRRPVWRTVAGGSRTYVDAIAARLGARLRCDTAVTGVTRLPHGVEVRDTTGHREIFDHAILAAHAPESLAMLTDASAAESAILGACRTAENSIVLHRDSSLMPRRKRAWASWNVRRDGADGDRPVAVTYWMNALQGIDAAKPLFVSLNPARAPAPQLTFLQTRMAHPQFDAAAIAAQDALASIQGQRRTWFCGAWTTYGFHEDGLQSGLAAASALGVPAPWAAPATVSLAAAA